MLNRPIGTCSNSGSGFTGVRCPWSSLGCSNLSGAPPVPEGRQHANRPASAAPPGSTEGSCPVSSSSSSKTEQLYIYLYRSDAVKSRRLHVK